MRRALAVLFLVAVCLQLAAPVHKPLLVQVLPQHAGLRASRGERPVHTKEVSRGSTSETFIATAYAPTGHRCKDGSWPVVGQTIAVDPSVIPLGSKVLVNGQEKVATDTGLLVKGRRIDLFMGSRKEAEDFGVRLVEVEVVPNNP